MWLNVGGLGWHHITWSGIGNSNVIILFNLLVMGGCFFSKSFERGKSNILVLFLFFFGRSGSCSERLANMSGSSSARLVRSLHGFIRKRSGSSSLHLISSKPFFEKGRSQELAPSRGARLSLKPSFEKGRSQELAPTRGARFFLGGTLFALAISHFL